MSPMTSADKEFIMGAIETIKEQIKSLGENIRESLKNQKEDIERLRQDIRDLYEKERSMRDNLNDVDGRVKILVDDKNSGKDTKSLAISIISLVSSLLVIAGGIIIFLIQTIK